MTEPRILVAGVGNIFLGDDGFGVEVVRRMAGRPLPAGVRAADFGIRGLDLTYALLEPFDLVVLVDAVRRGERPGTLYLMEVSDGPSGPASLETHGMVPSQVFRAVRSMGGTVRNAFVVACEPETFGDPDTGRMGLSSAVEGAVEEAVGMIDSLIRKHFEEARAHA